MCSKRAEHTTEKKVPRPPPGVWSITGRLTMLYTVSAGGLLILSAVFLYWVLASNLTREGHQFLADKMHVLRGILRDHPHDRDALEEEVQLEVAAYQYIKYYVRVLEQGGSTLLETPGMTDALPATVFPAPTGARESPEDGTSWRAQGGRAYHLIAAWAEVGPAGETQRLVQLGLDVSRQAALLATYRRTLALVLSMGMVVAAGAGIVVARRGMRPLAEITHAAQHITATQLHARIGPVRWPTELTALAATFDEMLTRLEHSFTRLAQFSVDLAHELRTPINNLMGEAEVALARTRTPDEYQQLLGSSLEEYGKLSRMIDSLLFLARAESPETHLERIRLDARQELEALREFYEAMAEEYEVKVRCEGQAWVHADPILFRRAVSNLLSNALHYTPYGGTVTLSVTTAQDHTTLVRVCDTGVGIAPEHLPKIFDRFYRVDPARSQRHPGMGLGLAIVKSILELHGGMVTVQSVPYQGTTITLSFPPPADARR
jgi:two-component system, OmpR family, heavy metal sensor histidine kinase CusS